GIVEEGLVLAEGLLDDLLDRQIVHPGFRCQLVAGVNIGLVVLVVMVLKRLPRHVGLKRLVVIGQVRQFKGHVRSPSLQVLKSTNGRWGGEAFLATPAPPVRGLSKSSDGRRMRPVPIELARL